MNRHKIAILTDSGTDVPREFAQEHGIFIVPLIIQYNHGSFLDGVDIDADEVYSSLHREVPKTSLPPAAAITDVLERIRQLGYEKVLMISISSGLSGTFGMFRIVAQEASGLDCRLVDTKNIGIGAGLTVIRAAELVDQGLDIDEVQSRLEQSIGQTKVFFSLATLEYLAKGGRIGKVAATVGTVLGVKPVISCNSDGVYYTVERVRGRMQSISATVRHAADFVQSRRFNLAIAHGGAQAELEKMKGLMGRLVERAKTVFEGQISPALGVHTGPG